MFIFNSFINPAIPEQKEQFSDYSIVVDNGVIYDDNGSIYIIYPLYDKTNSIVEYKKIMLPESKILFEGLFMINKSIILNSSSFNNNVIFNFAKKIEDDKSFNESASNILRIYDIVEKYTKYNFHTLNRLNELISSYNDKDKITPDALQFKELKIKLMITVEKRPVYDKDNKEFWISNVLDLEIFKNEKLIRQINIGTYADLMFFYIYQNKLYLCFNVYQTDMFSSNLAIWDLSRF